MKPHARLGRLPDPWPSGGILSTLFGRILRLGAGAAILALVLPQPAAARSERLVLAFYYAWYDSATWRSGQTPDLPATLYASSDPEAMARQIEQAQRAGIDAFLLNWWGSGNPTDANLAVLLDLAADRGFRVGVDFDPNSPFVHTPADYAASLRYLLGTHAHHSAYLRSDGRPVVFFFNTGQLSVEVWRQIRDQVDPQGETLWIAEGTDLGYQAVFDGHHLYSVAWANQIPPSATLPKWGQRVNQYNAQRNASKLWVATVMPGYDDTHARPNGFVVRRRGGDYYRECWQAALASDPDWVVINSWNEWPEGSYIEPSQSYGELFLEITRDYVAQFKAPWPTAGATAAAPPPPSVPAPPTPSPTPRPPDYAVEGGWYFTQAGPEPGMGFAVTDEDGMPFWTAYFDRGGPLGLGYPTSGRYRWRELTLQGFQQGVMVWHPGWNAVVVRLALDAAWLARWATIQIR
jgi:hypothetical protein